MTNCTNETMRDLLPDLVHGALATERRAAVDAHLASCAACADELRILRGAVEVFRTATPRIDAAAILARLPQATTAAAAPSLPMRHLTSVRTRSRVPRRVLALAASLLLMVTVSSPVWGPRVWGPSSTDGQVEPVSTDSAAAVEESIADPAAASTAAGPGAIVAGTDLRSLDDDALSSLLEELEGIEANVDAEPVTLASAIVNIPEGL